MLNTSQEEPCYQGVPRSNPPAPGVRLPLDSGYYPMTEWSADHEGILPEGTGWYPEGGGVPGLAGVVQPIEGIVYRRMAPCPLPAPPPLHSLRSFRGYSLTVVAFTSTMDRATSEGRSTRGAGADRGAGVCLSVIPVPTWYHTD